MAIVIIATASHRVISVGKAVVVVLISMLSRMIVVTVTVKSACNGDYVCFVAYG